MTTTTDYTTTYGTCQVVTCEAVCEALRTDRTDAPGVWACPRHGSTVTTWSAAPTPVV